MSANLLLRAGHDVQVLERSSRSLEGRGAGIVTHAELRQTLGACGAVVDETLGVAVASRVVLGPDGQAVCSWDHPQILTSWGRLYSLLRAALPETRHRLGAGVVAVTQDEQGAQVQLASGERWAADLVVAADGIRSSVRSQIWPHLQPHYAGYVAWRGVCDEAVLSRHTLRTLFPFFGFGLPAAEQLIGYPVAGANDSTAAGQRRWNFVWYRPASAGPELADLMTDADGRHHADGIPPQQVSWRHMAAVRAAARQHLAPQFAEVLEKTAVLFLQPIFDLVSPTLAHGRVALLGDAALVARPHVGMGVAKAAADAEALVASIAQHGATPAAVQAYSECRHPAGLAVVRRAQALGAHLQARPTGHGAPDQPSMPPRSVMHTTAIDPSLFNTFPPQTQAA